MTTDRNASGPADMVLTGGRVRTMDDGNRIVEAIAIAGERVAAVGNAAEIERRRGPKTRVVELRGRSVTPGFQDAHCHPVFAGIDLMRCALHSFYREDEYLDAIQAYATAHPDEPWILGGGWSMGSFEGGYPNRELLDRVTGGRPAFFDNRDGHDAWVNTAALALARIDRDTPDPVDGRIERDAAGVPTGALHEGAMKLVTKLLPEVTDAQNEQALLIAQAYLHKLGITAWQDAIVGPREELAYRAVAGRDELTSRVVGALWWKREEGLEQIDELVERRARGPVGRFSPTSVKLMLDGIIENGSAKLTAPYLDSDGQPTDKSGLDFIEPERLKAAVSRLDALGFQCHFHAIGDGASRLALDACEAALAANGRTDGRHHVSHIQVVHPDDVPRFGALGVIANAQPLWACSSEQMVKLNNSVLGPERTTWQYPFRSLLRTGARMAMGSDWAVSTPNALEEMDVAIRRVDPHGFDKTPFRPDESLTLDEALAAFTRGSAYANHLDDTGVLAPGMLADLAVLDRDIGDLGAANLSDAKVVATVVGGTFVFEDAAL
jgi:predicted amidohydrolase YtcJ